MSRESKILVAILVVVVGGMVALFSLTSSGKAPASVGPVADQSKLTKPDSHKLDTGSVKVVEFGDYQCPACGQAHPILKKIMKEYKGKISFYFRNFPLTQLHSNAIVSAQAAEAAAKQDKFWEMHDKLYETQSEWSTLSNEAAVEKFNSYATALGLNLDQFKQDEASEAIKAIITGDTGDGNSLKIQGTPTIFVNGHQSSDYNHNTIKSLIDESLKK